MTNARPIPPLVGLLGSLFCSLVLALEFGLGFNVRDLSLNIALGLAWFLVVAFALFSYRMRGLWVLLSLPLAIYLIQSLTVQITVACSLNSQMCP
ncbi:MAG: hypothetical protein ACRED4_07325 [Brevundimonas sp.]